MLDTTIQGTIKGDFEKMISHLRNAKMAFGFDIFGAYACSILNFYVGAGVLPLGDKKEAALYICRLYNAGIKNCISEADLLEISESLIADPTLDYQVLSPIFA